MTAAVLAATRRLSAPKQLRRAGVRPARGGLAGSAAMIALDAAPG